MTKARRRKAHRARTERTQGATPRATFANAIGTPVGGAAARTVIELLGGVHEVRGIEPSAARYDADTAGAVAWDFPSVPPANRYTATHIGVKDETVVWLTLSPALVDGALADRAVFLHCSDGDEVVFRPGGAEWNWAPAIIRRGAGFLLHLDVGQGHWDGTYKFRLTPRQAELLRADPGLYRRVWDDLVRICQSRRFLDDPATLPADAQAVIDTRCGRD